MLLFLACPGAINAPQCWQPAVLVFGIRILIAKSCTKRRGIYKRLSRMGVWPIFLKTSALHSLLHLVSNEPTISQIHLAGQSI
jgi:hypothetical protein